MHILDDTPGSSDPVAPIPVTGVILAGGLGTRMGGVAKAFLDIGGLPIIERLLAVYRPLFEQVIIATREAGPFARLGLPLALDRFGARSSLTGIHAGLSAMTTDHGFFAACDAPFLQTGLVRRLLARAEPGDDVVLPLKEDGYREPLTAVYSRRCLPHITRQLEDGNYKIIDFFHRVKVREVPVAALAPGDPDLISFLNVNRPEDLALARKMAEETAH
ncbi:NTP transferase domain-containing protein [Pseudodesulfovibrio sp. F-1]|uniref:Probable molybdenum cofactor guanylyltransferase n=1 Tax=Pseudodesulfovibrio alkaliphilus TaxID=2661613 RepID=A0A7K1KKY1_9BACT|nr:molybdenum cofactor guanylyltransferase [Pseudodesulfovibrio alkaliphilus]MUM76562.1 NTP transferase domain-containing protein [Pseudodesulfovibrio alkaliphilus]